MQLLWRWNQTVSNVSAEFLKAKTNEATKFIPDFTELQK